MGFLTGLWRVIMTAVVVVPKLWPLLKHALSFALDHWAKRRVSDQREEDLKNAAKVAEEKKDTSALEDLSKLGSGSAVSEGISGNETPIVAVSSLVKAVDPEPSSVLGADAKSAASFDPDITEKIVLSEIEEKKSPEIANTTEIPGWLTSSIKIGGIGIGAAILASMFTRKESKAASMSFGSSTSSVIQDASGTIKNTTVFRGGSRLSSRLLPVLLAFIMLGCASKGDFDRNEPYHNPKLFSADSKSQSLIRKRGEAVIRCDQPAFNQFICMSYTDLLNTQRVIDACQRFSDVELEK